ncbi:TRAP transporter fused permease subunit [Vibrio sp. EA2]|uniref:TRAP transporter permease n=1 Tax=Vibrio sp. EA2 TaxID=3079860 RepID=UPI002949091A|nr:TRAP transporter fused permease subunit [Vibrio sp. EA2]MDV6250533.1 TRAP transporter fused permease subunit [Vibrio sp. EA2]
MRNLSGFQKTIIGWWLFSAAVFQLITAFTGILEPRWQRGIHILFLLPVAFLLFSGSKNKQQDQIPFYDWVLAFLSLLPSLYVIINNDALNMRYSFIDPLTTLEVCLGTLNIILILEAVRRAVVPAMAILIAVAIGYLFIAPYLPGVFYAKPVLFSEIIEMQFLLTDSGIYGSITGVSATFVALFVIFGSFMEQTKTGELLTDIACRLSGKGPGAPAKVAVISSGFFGSISGVAAANVYATGTFTIPLMKKLGYRPQFAGAVEAAASTGGMLMPPVMGAGAFVMSEITGVSYLNIVLAALIGAVLFYASLILKVHFTAYKEGMSGINEEDVVPWSRIAKKAYLFIPLVGLVGFLFAGYSPYVSANAAIVLSFIISFFNKETRMTPKRLFYTLESSGTNMVMIALACAGAGMVVAVVTHTGLALGIASVITGWSGGFLLPALFLIMVTSLILGMGLPCTPAYIIAITIGGPALLNMGVDLLAAHLFVFYFAILAGVTPPVCVPAYCGAAIAGSKPLQTGIEAFKLSSIGFVIPYLFIYNKAMLLQADTFDILLLVGLLVIAISLFAMGFTGFWKRKFSLLERVLTIGLAVGVMLLCAHPEFVSHPVVIAIESAIYLFLFYKVVGRFLGKRQPVPVDCE